MWTYEYSLDSCADRSTLWRIWSDVAGWPAWSPGTQAATLDGPFQSGSLIRMIPIDQDAITLRLVDVRPNERFTDEAEMGGIVVRTLHELRDSPAGGTRITYRTEITGPEADQLGPEIGPAITSDFSETVARLVNLAELHAVDPAG
jgi:uncharacterized protein YndB with AHSA1/START domain